MLTFKSCAAVGKRVSEFYRALRIKVKGFFQKARRWNDLKLVNGYELDLSPLYPSVFALYPPLSPGPDRNHPPFRRAVFAVLQAHETFANFCLFPAMYLRRAESRGVIDTEGAAVERSDYFIFNVVEL